MSRLRFLLVPFFLGLLLFFMNTAEAVSDTVEGLAFHPFTMDANNGTCVDWEEPNGPTRNCDPVDLIFPSQSVTEVGDRLQALGWSTSGIGSTQWLHFDDETLQTQEAQLYLNESSTLRYHIRLWAAPGSTLTTIGAIHHESGFLVHTIDMSWEDAEAFVAGQLCGAGLSCRSSELLSWQNDIQSQDPDGNADEWRGWANDGRVSIISTPPADFDWGSFDAQGGSGFGVYEADDVTVLPTGALAQLIWAGPDGAINQPQADGQPGGDDQLLDTSSVANGPPLTPDQQDKGYIPLKVYSFEDGAAQSGGVVTIRAWNAGTVVSATVHGDSITGTLTIGGVLNAPRWHVTSAPTAITLSGLTARPGSSPQLPVVTLAILLGISVVLVVAWRRSCAAKGLARRRVNEVRAGVLVKVVK